jgi:hypothetical protein
MAGRIPERKDIEWWPRHVRMAFAAVGRSLAGHPIDPDRLERVPADTFPNHEVSWSYLTEDDDFDESEGVYCLEIVGDIYGGRWEFDRDEMEVLARDALRHVQ